MRVSPAGRAFIGLHEGLRLTAYRCSAGVLTIGVGHTSAAGAPAVTSGMTISKAEADAILSRDLVKFEAAVDMLVKVGLDQWEFDALVSFTFNVGEGAFGRSTLLRKLNTGDTAGAVSEFARWNKSNGRVLAGLVRRRAEERLMFVSGNYTGVSASISRKAEPAPSTAAQPAPPPPTVDTNAVTIARLNLRKAPPTGDVILTLPDDQPVAIKASWHLVEAVVGDLRVEGWVSGDYLSISN